METTRSKDGTSIAFDRVGRGPAVIFVDGAMCYRGSGPSKPVADLLSQHFTVYTYDRRGRGDSGNTLPYAIEREIEDLAVLIQAAGGTAMVVGLSSGAVLALEAASRGLPITKLALYEAPMIIDRARAPLPPDFIDNLTAAVASDRRGDAVKMFMKLVGVPAFGILFMSFLPVFKKLTAIAHTLPYDLTLVAPNQQGKPLPRGYAAGATISVLAIDGGKSPAYMRNGMKALADVLPNATYRTLPGQTHMVNAKALVPVLAEFFSLRA